MIALVKSNPVSPARIAAFEILRRVEEGAYASVLLASREEKLEPRDRVLCHELVMGVLRHELWLDRLIEYYAKRTISELDVAVRLILQLGLYQLRFLSRIPASAAVNDSVNLVNLARLRSASGLVNAVLRRATREPDVDPANDIHDPIERLAVTTSHPVWLLERWLKVLGREEAEEFARANNEPAPVAFRVVTNRASEAEVLLELGQAGAQLTRSEVAQRAWRITGGKAVLSRMVTEGRVYVQDEASQLVAEIVDAKPGERILDLCSAPGSKTSQIADQAGDAATVVASDLHEHRLKTVIATAGVHGLESIKAIALDATRPLPLPKNSFDGVLVDAPCSGTGTLRRNPEIRWRISSADIAELSGRQKQLLLNAAMAVRPGGRLIYSTCSVEPEENEEVRQTFLENSHNFTKAEILSSSPLPAGSETIRTWPHRQGTDGFFICAFTRKS